MHKPQHIPNDIHIQGEVAYMVLTNRAGFPVAVTMIDAADVVLIRAHPHRWRAAWDNATHSYYVVSKARTPEGKKTTIPLHRYLLGLLPGMHTDHWNHNTLDNRRGNLRACTPQENAANRRVDVRPPARSSTRETHHIYVWRTVTGRWRGYVLVNGERHPFGGHATKEEALIAAKRKKQEMAA